MHINTDMHHVLSPVPHIGEKNPSRKLKVPVVSASLSVWSCWGRCHGYREQLPKTFFFFFWQVNRSKVDFFFLVAMPHQRNTAVTQIRLHGTAKVSLSSAVCWFVSRFFLFLFCTLLGDLDLPAPEVGLLDVLDAEVGVALWVLLLLVPWRCLIVGAVRVRRG